MNKITRRGLLGKIFAGAGLAALSFIPGQKLFAGEKVSLPADKIEKPWKNDDMDFYYECFHQGDEGFIKIAQKIKEKIRYGVERNNLARHCLMVDELPQGARASYGDVQSEYICQVNGSGKIVKEWPQFWAKTGTKDTDIIHQKDVAIIPQFEIATHLQKVFPCSYSESSLKKINAGIQLVIDAFRREETRSFVNLLNAASEAGLIKEATYFPGKEWNHKSFVYTNWFQKRVNDLFCVIEDEDMVVTNLVMHPKTLEYVKLFLGKDIFDECASREQKTYGLYGHIWTADVRCSDLIKERDVYALPSPDRLGVMPIRQDITSLPASTGYSLGFVNYEEIGMGLIYPEQASKITL